MITKTRPWRHIYHDVGIPRSRNHDIEFPRSKKRDTRFGDVKLHDIEKRIQISDDIVIPRRFFQRSKGHDNEISRLKNHDIEIPRPKSHDIEFLWNSDL